MTNLKIVKLNYWQTMVKLNDRKILVEDRGLKSYRDSIRFLWISRVALWLGSFIAFIGFFFFVGIVGRSEYLTEAYILDDWTLLDYFIRAVGGLLLLVIGSFITYHSSSFEKYYVQKVNCLLKSRNYR